MFKKNKQTKQNGGDGYVINVNEAIGGLPAFSRYSNNYRPIFPGELLPDIGNKLLDIPQIDHNINWLDSNWNLDQQNGGCGEGETGGGNKCNCSKEDPSIFDLIKQKGGNKNKNKITQFEAISTLSHSLSSLSTQSLSSLITELFLNNLSKNKPKKSKQLGGNIMQLQEILAPLGKNNLLVLAGLLLLHHFAVESTEEKAKEIKKSSKSFKLIGGDPFINSISDILAPLGVNPFGSAVILILLQQAFVSNKTITKKITKTGKSKSVQNGGNPLKDLIAPLGTNAFIATGLLILLEKMFTSKMSEIKKKQLGGKINLKSKKSVDIIKISDKATKHFEELFNLIAPISFNTFAKESFLTNMAISKSKK